MIKLFVSVSVQTRKDKTLFVMTPLLLKETLQHLQSQKKPISIIDIGCGQGEILDLLYKNGLLKGARVFGLDIDRKALNILKKKIPTVEIITKDALALSELKPNFFDLIICNQVIEHLEDPPRLIQVISKSLKNGGWLYITSVLRKWYGLYWYRNKYGQIAMHPGHLHEFCSSEEMKNLLTKEELKVKSLKIYNSSFPLGDYLLILLEKLHLIKFTNLREYYLNHPKVHQLASQMLFPPIPGYASIEAVARKSKI